MFNSIYGMGAEIRYRMDKEILMQFQRLPSLQSSYSGYSTLMGYDDDFEVSDFLSRMFTYNS